jgi:F-type H+-transporting ATPase subunit epsilon
MKIDVVSLEKELYKGEADKVIVKTTHGEITVLDNHLPLVTMLVDAPLRIVEKDGKEHIIDIHGGFLEVRPESHVVILASSH